MLKDYYKLTKPGIIYGNAMTCIAGFLLASTAHLYYLLLLETVVGVSFVIASACVINNCMDRGIDKKMVRTKKRGLVTGAISLKSALAYGVILGIVGFGLLAVYTNVLTVFIGLVGYIDYIVLYGWAKRHSVHSTIIGSISGATPVVAGYCALTDRFDTGAILLFLTLVAWQMPHFYAISIARFKDYSSAKLPVLPVKYGFKNTKLQILSYVLVFIIASLLLTVYGYTGYVYLVCMSIVGLIWLWRAVQGFQTSDDVKWARKMFLFSLIVIMVFSLLISFGRRLA